MQEVGSTEACEFICEQPKEMRRIKHAIAAIEKAWRRLEKNMSR
jgi:hypothetical protein